MHTSLHTQIHTCSPRVVLYNLISALNGWRWTWLPASPYTSQEGWPERILPSTMHVPLNFTITTQKNITDSGCHPKCVNLLLMTTLHTLYFALLVAMVSLLQCCWFFFPSFSCSLQVCFYLDSGSAAVRWRDIYMWFISGWWEISTWFSLFCGD